MIEEEFVAAIKANPSDDAPRLQYADWLAEKGRDDEAARQRGLVVSRKVDLYVYDDDDSADTIISNKMPIWSSGGWSTVDSAISESVYGDFLKVFGISNPKNNEVVRLVLAIESIDVGEVEIKATFKPFAAKAEPKRRKKS